MFPELFLYPESTESFCGPRRSKWKKAPMLHHPAPKWGAFLSCHPGLLCGVAECWPSTHLQPRVPHSLYL